jgi:hypothetical protein
MRHASYALAAAAVLLTGAASAQDRFPKSPRHMYQPAPSQRIVPKDEPKECLRNRATQKTECHTRDGWRRIADQLAAKEDGPAPQRQN